MTGAASTVRTFIDTNVFVYAVDTDDPEKQERAQEALEEARAGGVVLSSQVLQEFFVTVTRKIAQPLEHDEAAREVARLSLLDVVPLDAPLVQSAIGLCGRTSISLWDSLVVRAAVRAGCERLLTEDLNAGQRIDGVLVENPFQHP